MRQRIQQAIGTIRRDAWGEIDLTSNPFLHTWTQLAALYRQVPLVIPPEGGEDVAVAVAEAGLWTLMPRLQRDTLGLREMLLYVDVDPGGRPVYQPVYPDLVEVLAVDPWQPARPTALKVWRRDPLRPEVWTAYVYDARGEGSYQATDAQGRDVSAQVLRPAGQEGGAYRGAEYPWRLEGRPVLPFVVYHAEDTGSVWDAYSGREVVEGALQLGVLYTYYNHIIRNAAWGQRYVVGAQPVGAASSPTGLRSEITTDPAALLVLEPMDLDGQGGQVIVGQWNSPVDPEKVLGSILRYERRLVESAVGAAEVTRQEADIRSGYSLAVSREAQEDAQVGYAPLFERADLEVLRLTAALLNGPTEGWSIQYPLVERVRAARSTATVEDAGNG